MLKRFEVIVNKAYKHIIPIFFIKKNVLQSKLMRFQLQLCFENQDKRLVRKFVKKKLLYKYTLKDKKLS